MGVRAAVNEKCAIFATEIKLEVNYTDKRVTAAALCDLKRWDYKANL